MTLTFNEAITSVELHFPEADDSLKLQMVIELMNRKSGRKPRVTAPTMVKEEVTHICSEWCKSNLDEVCDIPVYRIQMVRERTLTTTSKRISCPADAAAIFRQYLEHLDRECCAVLLVDAKNAVTGVHTVSVGDLTSSIVHPREVLRPAIVGCAASIILGHNHPSGDPTPSTDDVSITRRVYAAAEHVGIELLDHIVIGDGSSYSSLKEKGLF